MTLWLLLALGCAKDPEETDTGQSFCDDAPVTTWDNFGQRFLIETCQTCHASTVTGDDRNGAPPAMFFDTEADVAPRAAAILSVATGERAFMPPGGGVDPDDLELLEIWLTCFPPE